MYSKAVFSSRQYNNTAHFIRCHDLYVPAAKLFVEAKEQIMPDYDGSADIDDLEKLSTLSEKELAKQIELDENAHLLEALIIAMHEYFNQQTGLNSDFVHTLIKSIPASAHHPNTSFGYLGDDYTKLPTNVYVEVAWEEDYEEYKEINDAYFRYYIYHLITETHDEAVAVVAELLAQHHVTLEDVVAHQL